MEQDSEFLMDTWYLAAFASEVGEKPLARTIAGVPVVFFRDGQGAVKALYDRCPHRFAPLSRGQVVDGSIECGYHGMMFDGSGACVGNPHGPVPRAARVPSYPVVEAHKGIWIWLGEAELADPASIPPLGYLAEGPETAYGEGVLWARANYLLFVDNIMDLSHADYIHTTSLGVGAITRAKPEIQASERSVRIKWSSPNERPIPLQVGLGLFQATDLVDTVIEVVWTPPSVLQQTSTVTLSGDPNFKPVVFHGIHVMTPETATTLNYFHASSRDFLVDNVEFTNGFNAGVAHVFATEDAPMLEAQQERIGTADFLGMKPLLMSSDSGSVQVRRILAKMIAAEKARHKANETVAVPGSMMEPAAVAAE